MPWCPACERFLSPSTVRTDGTCPGCGRRVEAPARGPEHREAPFGPRAERHGAGSRAGEPADDEPLPPAPWHLKLLGGGVALYLGYRLFQGIEWLLHR